MTREDAISRQAVIDATTKYCVLYDLRELLADIETLPSVSTEKTDAYKQGWHDAIDMALKEAYTIHHYGEIFRVVQEETLMGLGMAYVSDTNDGKMGEQEGLYDFARWVATEVFDDMWEYNQDAFAEIACRKLAKLGIVRANGDEWELVEPQESEE